MTAGPTTTIQAIELGRLRLDGGTQARVSLHQATVDDYREAYQAGAEFPPVLAIFDGAEHWLADGFHRFFGAKAAGRSSIAAEVVPGTRRDAILSSLKANATHGLRRTSADKRKAIATMLDDPEWSTWSDRRIAEACGVSDKTVGAVRAAIFGNSEDAPTVRTVERAGKVFQQNTANIGRLATPAASPKATPEPLQAVSSLADAPAATGAEAATPPSAPVVPASAQDNAELRALFTLPPIQPSASTALAVPEMPTPLTVTGDQEVDAVLWLQSVVDTGSPALIEKALEAAKRIKTPMKELADRYASHIVRSGGAPFQAAFATMNFGELEPQATRAAKRATKRHEAVARFGCKDAVFADTRAEVACMEALRGIKRVTREWGLKEFDDKQAARCFAARADLTPRTMMDVLHVLEYERALYVLREATERYCGEGPPEFQAHSDYAFASLARIPPRDGAEALTVLDYLLEQDHLMGRTETAAILRNLVTGGRSGGSSEVPA